MMCDSGMSETTITDRNSNIFTDEERHRTSEQTCVLTKKGLVTKRNWKINYLYNIWGKEGKSCLSCFLLKENELPTYMQLG